MCFCLLLAFLFAWVLLVGDWLFCFYSSFCCFCLLFWAFLRLIITLFTCILALRFGVFFHYFSFYLTFRWVSLGLFCLADFYLFGSIIGVCFPVCLVIWGLDIYAIACGDGFIVCFCSVWITIVWIFLLIKCCLRFDD